MVPYLSLYDMLVLKCQGLKMKHLLYISIVIALVLIDQLFGQAYKL